MNCSKCGQPIQDGQSFCLTCGTPVNAGQAVPQQVPQQQAPAANNGFDFNKVIGDATQNAKSMDFKNPKTILPFAGLLIWLIGLFLPIVKASYWGVSVSANSFDTVRGGIQLVLILATAVVLFLKKDIITTGVAGVALLIGLLDLVKAGESVRELSGLGSRGTGYFFILIGMLAVAGYLAWEWLEKTGVLKKKA